MPATLRPTSLAFFAGAVMLLLAACGRPAVQPASPSPMAFTAATSACTAAPAATHTSRPGHEHEPTFTPDLRPTATSTPSPTLAATAVQATFTPWATWTPTRVPVQGHGVTPAVVTHTPLTDADMADLVLQMNNFHVEGTLRRQDIDVNGDGTAELLVAGEGDNVQSFVAIFGRAGVTWREWFFEDSRMWGKYCSWSRAAVRDGMVIADFLACNGGAGIFTMNWDQGWVGCEHDGCRLLWRGPIAYTWYGYGPAGVIQRAYETSELQREGSTTIRLIRRRWSLYDIPTGEALGMLRADYLLGLPAQLAFGPDTVDTYRWDGRAYTLVNRQPIRAREATADQEDALTRETGNLISQLAWRAAERPGGAGTYGADVLALEQGLWGAASSSEQAVALRAAAHSGPPDVLGPYVAGVIASDKPERCLVTALHYDRGSLSLIGRAEIPCTPDFSRARFLDLTGDGTPELVVSTLPPDTDSAETAAGTQRAYVFAVEVQGLRELGRIEGAINGPDGEGIHLVAPLAGQPGQILAGLPLISEVARTSLPDTLARTFRVYTWDAITRSFVQHGVWTAPGLGPFQP